MKTHLTPVSYYDSTSVLIKTVFIQFVKQKASPTPHKALWPFSDRVFFFSISFSILKADFHSVQFIERAEFCDCFLLKCVQSAISNEIRST